MNTGTSERQRRVDMATFQKLCTKLKARQDQVHVLDVSEAVFGEPSPSEKLPRRIWELVDEIVEDYLSGGGYCVRVEGNKLYVLIPKLTKSLGELKVRALTGEIARSCHELMASAKEEAEPAPPAKKPGVDAVVAIPAKAPPNVNVREEEELRAQANQAFAAMASKFDVNKLTAEDLVAPTGIDYRFVPVWNVENNMVIGTVIEPLKIVGEDTESGHVPVSYEEHAELDLSLAAATVTKAQQIVRSKELFTVGFVVQWSTLDRLASRNKLMELCSRLSDEERRITALSIEGVPEDLLPARLDDRLRQLANFFRFFALMIRLGRRDFSQIKGLTTVRMFGVDLDKEDVNETGYIAELNALTAALAPYKRPFIATNVATKSQLLVALSAGAVRISGRVIPDNGAFKIRRLALKDIYTGRAST